MRGTLSQPQESPSARGRCAGHDASASDPARGARLVACAWLSATAVLACFAMACDRGVEPTGESSQRITRTRNEVAADDAAFAWPEDPGHPVLGIDVEWADSQGRILIELVPELAPATVAAIIELADDGFYDGTTFHRVIPGFMIQGGDPNSRDRDPTNDGRGGPGRPLHDEFGQAPFVRGVVGLGNKGRENSTSTQLFIMHADNQNLDGRYTVIGRVLEGMALVDEITDVAIDRSGRWGPKDRPIENVVLSRVRTIGQLAAVQADLEAESQPASEATATLVTAEPAESVRAAPASRSAPPASLDPDDDWRRLEAAGR